MSFTNKVLVKTVSYPTDFVLPCIIQTDRGYFKKNRYYDCESSLFRAYRQLKAINGRIKPLYPVVFETEVIDL